MFKLAIMKLEQEINMAEVMDTQVKIRSAHIYNVNQKILGNDQVRNYMLQRNFSDNCGPHFTKILEGIRNKSTLIHHNKTKIIMEIILFSFQGSYLSIRR